MNQMKDLSIYAGQYITGGKNNGEMGYGVLSFQKNNSRVMRHSKRHPKDTEWKYYPSRDYLCCPKECMNNKIMKPIKLNKYHQASRGHLAN